jgi:hypothetical protein
MRLHDHRLLELCRLLATNSDKFVSATFAELDPKTMSVMSDPAACAPRWGRTLRRYCEQAAGRSW